MSANIRDEELIRLINETGYVTIQTLAEKTFTSCSTIRRDLQRLEQQGLIRRRHGGAESVLTLRPTSIIRRQLGQSEKASAAGKAAAFVRPGSTIFIDASTTAQYMIPHLSGIENLTVWTNGIDTAMRLTDARIRAVSTGGELFAESMAYVGPVAAEAVRRVRFDAVFFSSAGFDDETVSDWSEAETVLRRIVLEQSKERYFLADPSKRDKKFTYIVCRTGELDGIFCS
ncbi:MAG: DeoR/GlpR transcriptional regulator [Oscillospiraceae bacterium]|nr:DeoR/GlpR transcriptional regulator [Oscillospiraceae bacterium]